MINCAELGVNCMYGFWGKFWAGELGKMASGFWEETGDMNVKCFSLN